MDILLTVIDDNIVENDEVGKVIVEASVPFVSLGIEDHHTVSVRILDDDGKVASFDSSYNSDFLRASSLFLARLIFDSDSQIS